MRQYLLSVWFDEPYDDDVDLSAPETRRQMAQTDELNAEMQRAGAWVFVAGLRPASSATPPSTGPPRRRSRDRRLR